MATRVIIAKSLRASKTLKKRICGQDHIFDFLDTGILTSRNRSDILHDPLRRFSFASTRLSGYYDTLVFMIGIHVVICAFGNAKNMGRDFKSIFSPIPLEGIVSVDAQVYNTRLRTRQSSLSMKAHREKD